MSQILPCILDLQKGDFVHSNNFNSGVVYSLILESVGSHEDINRDLKRHL